MNVGVVDIGSNSVRFSIYEISNLANKLAKTFTYAVNERYMLGLIGYVYNKRLSGQGIELLCDTLVVIGDIVKEYPECKVFAFATACLRNIENTNDVIKQVHDRTGILIDVLSGELEARYSFKAALFGHEKSIDNDSVTTSAVVDIGGGSTEVIYYNDSANEITQNFSEAIGSLVLHKSFCQGIIPTIDEYKNIEHELQIRFGNYQHYNTNMIIGVGGTCKALLMTAQNEYPMHVCGNEIEVVVVDIILNTLLNQDVFDCERFLKTNAPERMLTMYTGLMILSQVIKSSKAKKLCVTEYGVKEGFLIDKYLENTN